MHLVALEVRNSIEGSGYDGDMKRISHFLRLVSTFKWHPLTGIILANSSRDILLYLFWQSECLLCNCRPRRPAIFLKWHLQVGRQPTKYPWLDAVGLLLRLTTQLPPVPGKLIHYMKETDTLLALTAFQSHSSWKCCYTHSELELNTPKCRFSLFFFFYFILFFLFTSLTRIYYHHFYYCYYYVLKF